MDFESGNLSPDEVKMADIDVKVKEMESARKYWEEMYNNGKKNKFVTEEIIINCVGEIFSDKILSLVCKSIIFTTPRKYFGIF